jgi:glutathione synthase
MAYTLGVLMDPLDGIKPWKDSTVAMLLEAMRRGHSILQFTAGDVAVRGGQAFARMRPLRVRDARESWFDAGQASWQALTDLSLVLARKDPPFDVAFLHDTLVLDLAVAEGVPVVNSPGALRDANEKLASLWFPDLAPPTRVSRDLHDLAEFVRSVGDAVVKPLDAMGGQSIFKTRGDDPNLIVILETLTHDGREFAMAQRFIPEAADGDKRILLVGGEPVPFALARIPQGIDFRGNMARGGRAEARPLTAADRRIAERVGAEALRRGLEFVGIDVIGEYLTEVNVTSPTGIREIDAQCGTSIATLLFDRLDQIVANSNRR